MISRLGRFEIQDEIGRGGFGQVFRAFDPVMNRIVAVKVLTATDDAGSFNRFKNEATAAGNLHHENIVTVYEFGQEAQTPFLVMEFLNGEDLAHFIKNQTPLSLYQKVRIMDQVADGLHCAHINGVLHRDVKPANIMVLKDGAVKIMDFGIARLMRDTATRLTMQGYLIGTVVYMAPELFSGEMEVDSLCDIWSYGVIMYELLNGKNPFQTGSMQSEMYRIVNVDPPALPPEQCPADLQAVLSKLLSRQRDHRYQTLEETRFDLQPILKNLEKAEADRLVSIAQQLMFQEQLDEALDAAGKARKLDPNNGPARIIFKQIQDRKRMASVRPRVDALIQRGNELAEQMKLGEAIEILESALKIDPANERVLARIQELRKLKSRRDEAARQLTEAEKDFRDGYFANALEHASEAVQLDPDNQEASRLLDRIQSQLQAQDAERALEAEILRARGLMAIDDLDGAMATLKAAESKYPGRANTGELVARVAQLIIERDQRREYARRKEHAKDLVRNARFAEAVDELEKLRASAPNDAEVNDLLPYAKQELRASQRGEDVKRITEMVADLNRAQRFEDSIRALEDGLKKYPDDLTLTKLLRSTHFDHQNQTRELTFRTALQRCEAFRQSGQFQQALDLIAQLIVESPNNPELAELEAKIRQEKNRVERAATVARAKRETEQLLRENKAEQAVGVLESAMLSIGGDRELAALLEKAKAQRQAERDRQYIESELKHAKVFEDRGDNTTSLRIIEDALGRSPDSPELIAARDRLRKLGKRAQEVTDLANAIEGLLLRKEWALALGKLDRAKKSYPMESVFVNLDEDLRRRKSEHVNQLVRECQRLLDSGQAAAAEQFLSVNLLDFRDDPEVARLGNDILTGRSRRETQDQIAESLRGAEDCERQNDLAGALDMVQRALQRFPQDPDLLTAQRRIKQAQLLALIRQALQRSDWAQAMQFLEQARQGFPTDPALIPLQADALDQRRAFLENAAAAVRAKLHDDRIEDAAALFQQSLAGHQDQGIVRAVSQEIDTARLRVKTVTEKRDILQQAAVCEDKGDFAGALAILNKAQPKYPGDADVRSAISQVERKRAVAEKAALIKKDVDRGLWQDALKKLAEARTSFPDNPPPLDPLEQQARKLREQEIQKLVDKAKDSLKQRKVADAEKILNKQLAPFASEPAVAALAKAIRGARAGVPDVDRGKGSTPEINDQETGARPKWQLYGVVGSAVAAVAGLAIAFWPAKVSVTPDKLQFEYAAGNPPEAQTVTVTGIAEVPVPRTPDDWLLVTRSSSSADKTEFKVRVLPDKLAPKTYSAVLNFPHDLKVPVDLKVTATGPPPGTPPTDPDVQPSSITFQYSTGNIPGQRVAVTSTSSIPDPKTSERWISFTRHDVGHNKAEFLVQASANGLPDGRNTAYLVFTPTKKLRVELTIPPKPGEVPLEIQPDSLAFPSGGAQQIVRATGPPVIPDPVSTDPWLTFTRRNVGPGKAEFIVQTSAAGLAAATHIAYLNFSTMKKVRVELTVAPTAAPPPPPPPFEVQPKELHFTWKRTSPVATQIVTATGPQDLADPRKTAPWLTVTRRGTTGSKTEFVVQITPPDKLAGGNHTDDIVFTGPNGQQKSVRVDLLAFDLPENPGPFGTAIWSGATLNPGDEIWIKERMVLKGPGKMNSRLPRAEIVVTKLPASIHVVEEPSQENNFVLHLAVVSGTGISDLAISWTSKK